ncbi:hypothetical protein FF1_029736 [Malus domestica]
MTLSPTDNDLEQSAFVLFNLRDSHYLVIKIVSSFAQIGAGLDLSGSGRSRAGKETKMGGNVADAPEDAGADDLGFEWMEERRFWYHFKSFNIIWALGMAADALLKLGLMVGGIRTPPSTSSSPNRKLGLLSEPWVLTWACDEIRYVLV